MGLVIVVLVGSLAACTPFERTPPAYFAQTAAALPAGHVEVVGVGGGGGNQGGAGAGGSGRLRVGVGGDQEVSAEASMLGVQENNDSVTTGSANATDRSLSGRLGWKHSFGDGGSAVVVGSGFTRTAGSYRDGMAKPELSTLSFDAGWLTTSATVGTARFYTGGRVVISVPVARSGRMEGSSDDGPVGALIVGAGLELPLGKVMRAYMEAGPTMVLGSEPSLVFDSFGVYGAIGLGVSFGR